MLAPARELKGSPVAIRWICGLLFLTSIFAYSRIGAPPHRAGEPRSEAWALQSVAAPARDAANNDDGRVTDLSAYVYLHETRNTNDFLQAAAHANFCGE